MTRSNAVPLETRRLFRICGMVGLIGCASVVASDVIGWLLVDGYSPISQTISALAVGEGSWLVDLGLHLLAIAFLAAAAASWSWRPNGVSWALAAAALALLGLDVMVIAGFNQYAGQANPGADVHTGAVYVLGVLFALACLLAVPGLKRLSGSLGRSSLVVGIAWIVLSPFFLLVPNAWDGAYERFLGLILVGWLAAVSSLFLRRGRNGALP